MRTRVLRSCTNESRASFFFIFLNWWGGRCRVDDDDDGDDDDDDGVFMFVPPRNHRDALEHEFHNLSAHYPRAVCA